MGGRHTLHVELITLSQHAKNEIERGTNGRASRGQLEDFHFLFVSTFQKKMIKEG